ncbi:hypothetical protein E4T56_gene9831 [Termitomyces sp. T112]|nr:hypothetical protein E4T56_gene9831 [Termitomyces sp. T112]
MTATALEPFKLHRHTQLIYPPYTFSCSSTLQNHYPLSQKVLILSTRALSLYMYLTLLKPRGCFWIDDIDINFYDDGPRGLDPNVDPFAASSFDSVIESLGSFSEVNNVPNRCSTNGKNDDPGKNWMGQVAYTAARQTLASLNSKWSVVGISSELKAEFHRQAEDSLRGVYLEIHMT